MLDEAGMKRIVAAIDRIDEASDGEIYCLIAQHSSDYREVSLAWAAIAALLLPPLGLVFGIEPAQLLTFTEGWTADQTITIRDQVIWALTAYAGVQAVLFVGTALLASIPAVRRILTPGFIATEMVRVAARQHFVSTGIHLAASQPHVLIYVSLAERRVEVLADAPIHAIAGDALWSEASDIVVAGMTGPDPAGAIVTAIERVGAPLIAHFPPSGRHPDVTADGVRQL
jgi:putative membrane protein